MARQHLIELEEIKLEDSDNDSNMEDVILKKKKRFSSLISLDQKSIMTSSTSDISSSSATSCRNFLERKNINIYTNQLSSDNINLYQNKTRHQETGLLNNKKVGINNEIGTTHSFIEENTCIVNNERVKTPYNKNICLKIISKKNIDKPSKFFITSSIYIRKWKFNRNLFCFGTGILSICILLLTAHRDLITVFTEGYQYVEGKVGYPYLTIIMSICGALSILTSRFPKRPLVSFVLLFSLVCFTFCMISLVYLLGEVNVNLGRLQSCWFLDMEETCICYTKEHFGLKTFRFAKVANCEVIGQLKNIVYGVTATFVFGCIISLVAAITSAYLLCKNSSWKCASEPREEDIPPQTRDVPNMRSHGSQTEECSFIGPIQDFVSPYHSESPTLSPKLKHDRNSYFEEEKHFVKRDSKDNFVPLFSRAVSSIECDSEDSSILDYPLNPPTYADAINRKC